MKRINGSWLEIHHFNEAEGKYFNPICHEFSDIQWKEKVKETVFSHTGSKRRQ